MSACKAAMESHAWTPGTVGIAHVFAQTLQWTEATSWPSERAITMSSGTQWGEETYPRFPWGSPQRRHGRGQESAMCEVCVGSVECMCGVCAYAFACLRACVIEERLDRPPKNSRNSLIPSTHAVPSTSLSLCVLAGVRVNVDTGSSLILARKCPRAPFPVCDRAPY